MTPSPRVLGLRWEVVRELAVSDFRLKYYDSALGYAWSMLSPLLMLAIYYAVFRFIIGVRTPGYLVYLLVGIVYWAFFQDCTFSGMTSLAARASVVKAIRVPAVEILAAGAASTVITLLINTGVLLAVLAAMGRLSRLAPLAVVPLVCLVLLATGLSALVALASVHFRDAGLVWNVLLQGAFWLTPIVYVVEPGPIAEVLYLNPLARCLYLVRWFLVYDYMPAPRFILLTAVACALVFAFGLGLFLRRQDALPESL